jgi:transglutaminase-like putative cysteine protease
MILRESAVEAKKLDKLGPAVDIIALTMIPSDPVPDSDRTTYLRARLANVPLRGFQLDGDRQTLKDETLEIRAEKPRAPYRLPSSDGNLMEFLRPSPFVQSDDPAIKNQAARILAGESDAAAAAKKLNDWVYTAIRKQPVVSIPSAVEVLKQKVGDCNEHTALYAALARSVGLPTRMAAGIVYMENGFYYHAWPEVWLGAWIAVDPTLDQFPADATHIRFTTGNLDRQMELMQLVGKLRVEVLEYKYNAEFGLRNAE